MSSSMQRARAPLPRLAAIAALLGAYGDAAAQSVTIPFAPVAAQAVPLPLWTVAVLALALAALGVHRLRRRLAAPFDRPSGGPFAGLLLAAILAAGSSGAWIPRVFAVVGATSFELELPGPTVSPILAVGVDVIVHNATGVPVTLGAPSASVPYQLVAPDAAPRCAAGLALPAPGACYVRLTLPPQPINQPPRVDAGADQNRVLGHAVQLAGSADDDGLPSTPGALTTTWSLVAGPLDVAFGDSHALQTPVTFHAPGTYTLQLSAFDGSLTSTSTTQVTVASAAPVIKPVADRTIPVGTRMRVVLSASDGDVLGTLTYSLPTKPAGAALAPSPIVDWTPTAAQLGQNTFTARVVNGAGQQAQTTFRVDVVAANRPPVLAMQPDGTQPVGTTFTRTLAASDPDPGDVLGFALDSGPPGMSLAGASLSWPTAGVAAGDYPVVVRVADAAGALDAALFVVSVVPASLPLANDDAYSVAIGQMLVVPPAGVLANDFGPGGALAAGKLTDPAMGTLQTFAADGGFAYQAPSAAELGLLDPTVDRYLGPSDGVRLGAYPPLVADLNGDGKPELIYWHLDQLYAVTVATGTLLFHANSLPAPYNGCAMYGAGASRFAVADIDDSGLPAIVMSAQCAADNFDYIYHAQDGGNHVVAIAYDPSPDNASHYKVKWLSAALAPQVPVPPPGDGHLYLPFQGMAADVAYTIARLAPAEKPTILFGKTYGGSDCGKVIPGKTDQHCRIVFAVDGATGALETPYYSTPAEPASADSWFGRGAGSYPAPIAADFDGSGALSIIYQGTWWKTDGTILRQFDGTATTNPGTHDSVVADLDGDGAMELIALEANGKFGIGSVKAWKLDGTLLWSFPVRRDLVITKLTVADIDRDGKPDILFGRRQTLFALGPDGAVKWMRSLPTSGFDFVNPFLGNDFPVYDLDGDGVPEIVVQVGKNTLHFLRGDTGETQVTWSYPGTFVEANQSISAPIIADLVGDGQARVGFYHDVNLNGTNFFVVLKSNNLPWQPAPTHLNQRAYWGTNFVVDATHNNTVPFTYTRQSEDPRTNVFGVQPQAPYVVPPKEKQQTSFTYEAVGAAGTAGPATVTIDITPLNRPPKFTSRPPVRCEEGDRGYEPTVTDPDPGDTVEIKIEYSDLAYLNPIGGVLYYRCHPIFGPRSTLLIATDSHGASAYQTFTTEAASGSAPVPDVVGDAQALAASALVAAGFAVGEVTGQDAAAPQGEVLAQFPTAGTSTLLGDRIDLLVSKGPPPAPVPDVVGRTEGAAAAALAAAGFTVDPAYAYSNTVAAGIVMQQSPAAGTIVTPIPANPVALTISAGTGLALRLPGAALQAGGSLPLQTVAIALDGTETPVLAVNYSIAPGAGAAGTAPSIGAASFATSASTRGTWRITATETGGSGRVASAEVVVLPADADASNPYWGRFARLGEALAMYANAAPAMRQAALAGDKAAMLALVQPIRAKLAQADLRTMRTADPWVLENGFLPTIAEVAAAGNAPTPEDQLFVATAKELTELMATIVAKLDPADPASAQEVAADIVQAQHLATLLGDANPTIAGLAGARPAIAAINAGLLPQALDAWLAALADRASKSAKAPPKLSLPSMVATIAVLGTFAAMGTVVYHKLLGGKGAAYREIVQTKNLIRSLFPTGVALIATAGNTEPHYRGMPTGIDAAGIERAGKVPENFTAIALSSYDADAAGTILDAVSGGGGPLVPDAVGLHGVFTRALDQIAQKTPGDNARAWQNRPDLVDACLSASPVCSGLVFNAGLEPHVPCTGTFLKCYEATILVVWDQTGAFSVSDTIYMLPAEDPP